MYSINVTNEKELQVLREYNPNIKIGNTFSTGSIKLFKTIIDKIETLDTTTVETAPQTPEKPKKTTRKKS